MKKFIAMILSTVMVLSLSACGGTNDDDAAKTPNEGGNAAQKVTFTMPTGSMGGSYYSSGTAMAQVLNSHVDGMDMSVSASNTQDNIATLLSGESHACR